MKIYVLSRKEVRKCGYIDKTFFEEPKRYFISIAGIADGCEYPHPFLTKDSKRVLHRNTLHLQNSHSKTSGPEPATDPC